MPQLLNLWNGDKQTQPPLGISWASDEIPLGNRSCLKEKGNMAAVACMCVQ